MNFSRIADNNKTKVPARKVSPPHRLVSRTYGSRTAVTRVSVTSVLDNEPGPRAPANGATVRSKRVIIDSASSSSNVTESETSDIEVDDLPSRLRGPIEHAPKFQTTRQSTARTARPAAVAAARATKRVAPVIDLTHDSADEDYEPSPVKPARRTTQARRTTAVNTINIYDPDSAPVASNSASQNKPAAKLHQSTNTVPPPAPPVVQQPPPAQRPLATVKPPAPRLIMQAVELPRLPASWRVPVKAPRAAASPVKRKVFTVSTPSRARAVIPTRFKSTQAPANTLHFLARDETEDEEALEPTMTVTKSVRLPSPSPTPSAETEDENASIPPSSPPPPPCVQNRKSVVPLKTQIAVAPPTRPAVCSVNKEEETHATARTVTQKTYAQGRRPPSPSPTPSVDSDDDLFTPPASPPPTRARKSVVPPKARATPIKAAARPSLSTSLRPAPPKPSTKAIASAPAPFKSRHATLSKLTPAYLQNLVHECGQDAPYDFDAFLSFFPYEDVHGLLGDAGLAYRKVGEASFSEVWAIGEVVLKVVPLRDPKAQARGPCEGDEMPDVSEVGDVTREVGMTREMGNVCDGFVKLLKYVLYVPCLGSCANERTQDVRRTGQVPAVAP